MYLIITSFSLLSAANCIHVQPTAWINPSELGGANNTAMVDIHDREQDVLLCWPLPFSPASTTRDPTANLPSHAAGAL